MKNIILVFCMLFSVVSNIFAVFSPQDWRNHQDWIRYEDEQGRNLLPGPRYAAQVRQNCNHLLDRLKELLHKEHKTAQDFREIAAIERFIDAMKCYDQELLVFNNNSSDHSVNATSESETENRIEAQKICGSYIESMSKLLKTKPFTAEDEESLFQLEKKYESSKCNDPKLLAVYEHTVNPKRFDFRRRGLCSSSIYRVLLASDMVEASKYINETSARKELVDAGATVDKKDRVQYEYNIQVAPAHKEALDDIFGAGAWDPKIPLTPEQLKILDRYSHVYRVLDCTDRKLFTLEYPFAHLLSNAQRYEKQKSLGWVLPDEYAQKINAMRQKFKETLDVLSTKELLTEAEKQVKILLESVVKLINCSDPKPYVAFSSLSDSLPSQAELVSHDIRPMELWHNADRVASERRKICVNLLDHIFSLFSDTTKPLTAEDQKTIEISVYILEKLGCISPELFKHYRYVEDNDITVEN